MKYNRTMQKLRLTSRPSCEGRGLKCGRNQAVSRVLLSSLMRGTWIEIPLLLLNTAIKPSSLMRGTWIEIKRFSVAFIMLAASSLMRGTWIEIAGHIRDKKCCHCRPSCEGRGLKSIPMSIGVHTPLVVPHARDVD